MEKLGSDVTDHISCTISNDGNIDSPNNDGNVIPIIAQTQTRHGPLVLDVVQGEY